ncbi:smad nuclear interacting protein [Echinococcus multilocularis]|uniref:Smad nuclear interacting protein n=1 Tax=Echinococcus multilocularis TaxID=6211 RepID=A0A087VWB6_ECHMU|nr:smad nuclear interacting protein [Echinococcus multilocularis]
MQAAGENATEMDELEAYMEAIKRGAPKRAERQALKRRLVALRQEETRLLRKVGIRGGGSSAARFSSSASSAAATAVRAVASQQSGTDGRTNEASHTEIFVPEVEEDDDSQIGVDTKPEHPVCDSTPMEEVDIGGTLKRPPSSPSQLESPKPKVARNEEAYSHTVSTDKVTLLHHHYRRSACRDALFDPNMNLIY